MNRIIGIYEAEIYEHENGDIRIAYKRDKDNNKECGKRNCGQDCCTHTFNKRFAINKIRRNTCPPIEL